MRITIDREKCMGSGNCSFMAPGTFDLDDDMKADGDRSRRRRRRGGGAGGRWMPDQGDHLRTRSDHVTLALTDEHVELATTVRRWVETRCPISVAREYLEAPTDSLPTVVEGAGRARLARARRLRGAWRVGLRAGRAGGGVRGAGAWLRARTVPADGHRRDRHRPVGGRPDAGGAAGRRHDGGRLRRSPRARRCGAVPSPSGSCFPSTASGASWTATRSRSGSFRASIRRAASPQVTLPDGWRPASDRVLASDAEVATCRRGAVRRRIGRARRLVRRHRRGLRGRARAVRPPDRPVPGGEAPLRRRHGVPRGGPGRRCGTPPAPSTRCDDGWELAVADRGVARARCGVAVRQGLHPGARRHRLHVGARRAPLPQARHRQRGAAGAGARGEGRGRAGCRPTA